MRTERRCGRLLGASGSVRRRSGGLCRDRATAVRPEAKGATLCARAIQTQLSHELIVSHNAWIAARANALLRTGCDVGAAFSPKQKQAVFLENNIDPYPHWHKRPSGA